MVEGKENMQPFGTVLEMRGHISLPYFPSTYTMYMAVNPHRALVPSVVNTVSVN